MTKTAMQAIKVLEQFGYKGYQKTSMQNIAEAMGISRQSVYKRFGSKEKSYTWAIHTYMADSYQRMFEALSDDEVDPFRALLNAFDIFIGEGIDLVNYPCGMKVLDDVLVATHGSEDDWIVRFRSRMADFLIKHDFVPKERAAGIAKLIIAAGKGALIEKKSKEAFSSEMKEMIESVIRWNDL